MELKGAKGLALSDIITDIHSFLDRSVAARVRKCVCRGDDEGGVG